MKKYIKRIWFTVVMPIGGVIVSVIGLPLEVWRGTYDDKPWDFWNR